MITRLLLVFSAALATLSGCQREPPPVQRANVERVLGALAHDSMRGRAAFTPDADRAARFIAREFGAIGLDNFGDLEGYEQRFGVFSVRATSARAVLNGREIPHERMAILASGPFSWSGAPQVRVMRVSAEADPMAAMRRVFGEDDDDDADLLVLVHPRHEELFRRLRSFAERGARTLDPAPSGRNTVLVMTRETTVESFDVTVQTSVEEVASLANVIGTIPGKRSDELVVFSAHYDHIGVTRPVDGDSIGNGANDDASGTTAVIELARRFEAMGKPERTLVFAAFTAEESGGYGSRYFAREVDPDRIVAMFNIEMIGKPSAEGADRAWVTGWNESDFGEILSAAMPEGGFVFYPDPYPDQSLFYRSDNITLARLGVPAHSISTTPIDTDPDYHRVSDEIETLDLDHMTATIEAIADAAMPIVSGEATPRRVDPARLR